MGLSRAAALSGRERLDDLADPVVFVANHNSHMDTPVILRALPGPVAAANRGGGRG